MRPVAITTFRTNNGRLRWPLLAALGVDRRSEVSYNRKRAPATARGQITLLDGRWSRLSLRLPALSLTGRNMNCGN